MPISIILDGPITTILEVPFTIIISELSISFVQVGVLAHLNTMERLKVGGTNMITIPFLVAKVNPAVFTCK